MQEILDMSFAGNDTLAWLRAAAWMVGAVVLMKIILPLVIRRISRWAVSTSTRWDDALVQALRAVRWYLIALVALHPASQELVLRANTERWMSGIATVAFFLQLGLCASAFISGWIVNVRQDSLQKDPSTTSALSILSFIGRVVAWAVLLLLLLDNLGFDVNALVAGLGIGGIAIGLALQNILGDLFASLSIVLDKPFQVGDFVVIDDFSGSVENIGLKTTRIRSLSGEILVFSNGDLTKSRLRNYKLMRERRIAFSFSMSRRATPDQVECIPQIVKDIVDRQEKTRFDRAHLIGVGESSFDFEVVYWMLVPDYTPYRDAHQAIHLKMMREFAQLGVDFAFPTRAVVFGGPEAFPITLTGDAGAPASSASSTAQSTQNLQAQSTPGNAD
ncbi:MAG: mechanosensitive ion channel [Simplicispira suum]|uniref:mechanosensitive ion channel family protein n=1 Tax=Simplicispira suum TaxID=2109915 RepID=UPI001C6B5D2F|nr:mechanosensitive ion channel domain-containing protein [Simplicispira suum]MBW7834422.1 mechanosensitive ion channel [Simplicispira suum]